VKKRLTKARSHVTWRAGGEESEKYDAYFEISEPFPRELCAYDFAPSRVFEQFLISSY